MKNKKIKILYLCEAGVRIDIHSNTTHNSGLGHLSRMCNLCDILGGVVMVHNFSPIPLRGAISSPWLDDLSSVIDFRADIIFIDSYLASLDIYNRLDNSAKLVAIDDYARLPYNCYVLNYNDFAPRLFAQKAFTNYKRLFSGFDFAPINRAFHPRSSGSRNDLIYLAIGGIDEFNIALKILQNLKDTDFSFIVISPHKAALLEFARSNNLKIEVKNNLTPNELARYMRRCTISITSASVSLLECLQIGLKPLAIITANNQLEFAHMIRAQNLAKVLTLGELVELKSSIKSLSAKQLSPIKFGNRLKELPKIIKDSDNYHLSGTRIYKTLQSSAPSGLLAVNFKNLSEEEKKEILKIRNHKDVRKFMHNKERITLKAHRKFIKNLNDKNAIYLAVRDARGLVGAISLVDMDGNRAKAGLYKNLNLKESLGGVLLELIEQIARKIGLKELILEVKKENTKAIKLYERHKYQKLVPLDLSSDFDIFYKFL